MIANIVSAGKRQICVLAHMAGQTTANMNQKVTVHQNQFIFMVETYKALMNRI
jgi:hypothetical protein